jgi:hypothetical protein
VFFFLHGDVVTQAAVPCQARQIVTNELLER